MKQYADKDRQDHHFQVGDFVLVKLQPYRQSTVAHRLKSKMSKHFFGPFRVIAKVGAVAYTLQLPSTSRIYPTFHVSQLKLFKGPLPYKLQPFLTLVSIIDLCYCQ